MRGHVPLGGICEAADEEAYGRLGSELDRLVVVGDGAIIVLLGGIGAAAVVEGLVLYSNKSN